MRSPSMRRGLVALCALPSIGLVVSVAANWQQRWTVLAQAAVALPASAAGQERVLIDDAGCAGCRIRLTRVAVITGVDPYTPSRFAVVVKTRNGYAAAPLDVPGTIGVFDSTGRFLRTVGSPGSGPGEFSYVASVAAGRGDSVLAHDRGNSRVVVLDPALRPVRVLGYVGYMSDIVPVTADRYAVSMRALSIPYPVQFLDSSGCLAHPFGPRLSRPGEAADRHLVRGPNGRIYAVPRYRYEIEEYDSAGHLLRVLERRAEWFTTTSILHPTRPHATITDMGIDERGRLLILVVVPVVENLPRRRGRRGEEGGTASMEEVLSQTRRILEVIDPETGRLIASGQAPRHLLRAFVGPGEIASLSRDRDDIASLTIWRIAVVDSLQGAQ